MKPELAKLIGDAKSIAENSVQTFGGLSGEQINWKPNAKDWSVGQCFEHLIVTNELYFPNIQKVVDGAHRNNFFSKIPFAVDLIAGLMKNSLKPEQPRKMKTFKIFEPAASDIADTIIADFSAHQQKLIALIEAANDFDIHQIKIAEPLSATLNLRLNDAFEILVMHEKRHFQQSARVMQNAAFPK